MIKQIVDLIQSYNFDDDVIHVKDLYISDQNIADCVHFLIDKKCIEDYIDTDKIINGTTISFDITWDELQPIGIYKSWTRFIDENQYDQKDHYYIKDLNCNETSQNSIINTHKLIIDFMYSLKRYAEYVFNDSDCTHIVLSQNSHSSIIDLKYTSDDVSNSVNNSNTIKELINVLSNKNEKQCLFLNEIIEYSKTITDTHKRFSKILSEIVNINKKAQNAYEFYLSGYSHNKLKIELDSKALDYTRRLQNVINDSQTKLIAIPTAFVLAFASIDWNAESIVSAKNIGIIISLYLFAILIQIFVSNQKNILSFIKQDLEEYKDSFKSLNVEKVSKRFSDVENVLKTQKQRFRIIELILWSLPIVLTLYMLFTNISFSKPNILRFAMDIFHFN